MRRAFEERSRNRQYSELISNIVYYTFICIHSAQISTIFHNRTSETNTAIQFNFAPFQNGWEEILLKAMLEKWRLGISWH